MKSIYEHIKQLKFAAPQYWNYNKNRLKVLHIGKFYPPHMGGMETHLEALANEQSKFADIEILVAGDSIDCYRSWENGIGITRVPYFGSFASSPLTWGLSREIARMNPDVVHIHAPNPMGMNAFLRSGSTARLVITHHGDIEGRSLLKAAIAPIWQKAMARADTIIVSSRAFADSSRELRPFLDKVRIVPFGLDISHFDFVTDAEVERVSREFGPFVLGVGRMVSFKGFQYLIGAMRNINANLVLIGSGPEEKFLRKVAAAQGVKTFFLGSLPQYRVAPFFRAASIFVLPSCARNESFGLVQLEAMHCGVPIINTQLASGVPEVSLHNVTGLTVKPADIPELHSAIDYLMRYPEYRATLGAAGKKRMKDFSVERMARETLDIYESAFTALPV